MFDKGILERVATALESIAKSSRESKEAILRIEKRQQDHEAEVAERRKKRLLRAAKGPTKNEDVH